MKLRVLCFVLLLACMYPSLAQGSYEDCCLRYSDEPKGSYKKKVVSYMIQETDGGCNIHAVIFRFGKRKQLCSDPKMSWVNSLMKKIDQKQKKKRDTKAKVKKY